MSELTLGQLVEEVGEWAVRNFGEQVPDRPLLGIMEEFGELCHSQLKQDQKIRGSEQEHIEKAKDAIADIFIYIGDFCSRDRIDLHRLVNVNLGVNNFRELQSMADEVIDPNGELANNPTKLLFRICSVIGKVAELHLSNHPTKKIVLLEIVRFLAVYCNIRDFNLQEIVDHTWNKVKQRDWKENPQDGGDVDKDGIK